VWLGVVSESVVNGMIDCRRPQKPGLDRPEVQRGDAGAGQHRVAGAEVGSTTMPSSVTCSLPVASTSGGSVDDGASKKAGRYGVKLVFE
jgi:hypothetical protein